LYREGTTTHVANLRDFPAKTPYIEDMRIPAIQNANRMDGDFVLPDTIIFRLAHDSNSHFSDLRDLGFDWDWQNPMYYAGARMARILSEKEGSLRDYLHQRPTAFARDYIKVCAASPKCPSHVSLDTAAIIFQIDSKLADTVSPPIH